MWISNLQPFMLYNLALPDLQGIHTHYTLLCISLTYPDPFPDCFNDRKFQLLRERSDKELYTEANCVQSYSVIAGLCCLLTYLHNNGFYLRPLKTELVLGSYVHTGALLHSITYNCTVITCIPA